jgi:uncharacterized membrane protein HdeD (DUF308 family)
VGAVVFDAHGEVVLVILEPAEHGLRVGRDEPDAPSETAVGEVGGGGVGVQRSEGIAATMVGDEAPFGNNAPRSRGRADPREITGMSMRINLTPDEERAVADAYSRTWWLWLIAGILWLLLGFIVLSLRPASITACAILIAIAFWLGGITQLALGFVLEGGWRWLAIIGGALALLAGIAAIVWPEPTLVVISVFVAWYLLIRGLFDVVIALSHTHVRGWWMPLIAGLVGIALGAWAIGNPDRSVLLLVSIIGIWSIFKGVADLMASFEYRRLGKELAA